jgi:hypothetical protein
MQKVYSNTIRKFCSEYEKKILNNWTLSHYEDPYFQDANMDLENTGTRLTTRFSDEHEISKFSHMVKYPNEAYDVKSRIIDYFKLQNYPHPQTFKNGIVNGIGFSGGSICDHIDPIYYENTHTLHCNIVTQNSEIGGVTIIEEIEHKVNDCDLLYYIVSKHNHKVTKIEGSKHRILWVFGFCIDNYKLNQIFP